MAEVPKNQALNLTRLVYRLTFSKKGRAKLISHLDLMRAMQRAIKRAHIPIWYTQGFNPHPYIMFPLALSLGVESEIEPMDIALLEQLDFELIKTKLNNALPQGIRIESVADPVYDHLEIYRSDYEIMFGSEMTAETMLEKFLQFINSEKIIIKKRLKPKKYRKESFKEIDVKEYVTLLSYSLCEDKVKVTLRLAASAGNDFNLNFTPLLQAFEEKYELKINYISAKRLKIICKNGESFM